MKIEFEALAAAILTSLHTTPLASQQVESGSQLEDLAVSLGCIN